MTFAGQETHSLLMAATTSAKLKRVSSVMEGYHQIRPTSHLQTGYTKPRPQALHRSVNEASLSSNRMQFKSAKKFWFWGWQMGSRSTCKKVECGDAKIENSHDRSILEQCDDGNTADGHPRPLNLETSLNPKPPNPFNPSTFNPSS